MEIEEIFEELREKNYVDYCHLLESAKERDEKIYGQQSSFSQLKREEFQNFLASISCKVEVEVRVLFFHTFYGYVGHIHIKKKCDPGEVVSVFDRVLMNLGTPGLFNIPESRIEYREMSGKKFAHLVVEIEKFPYLMARINLFVRA